MAENKGVLFAKNAQKYAGRAKEKVSGAKKTKFCVNSCEILTHTKKNANVHFDGKTTV